MTAQQTQAKAQESSSAQDQANLEMDIALSDILTPQNLSDYRYPHHLCDAIESEDAFGLDLGFGLGAGVAVTEKHMVSGPFKTFANLPPDKQLKQLERFKGICALYGYTGFRLLQRSHVVILGTGGVGSWIAESICRTGIGTLTLVDFDNIESSNSNRQLHTMSSTVGQAKADILAERLLDINPYVNLRVFKIILNKNKIHEQLASILQLTTQELQERLEVNLNSIENPSKVALAMRQTARPIFVAEAIDDLPAKCRCVDICHRLRIPIITSGGAGGRIDPTALKLGDVAQAQGDQLIKRLRTELRREFGYPKGKDDKEPFNILCTYSDEQPILSHPMDKADHAALQDLGLDSSNIDRLPELPNFGASMSVTATAGLLISSELIHWICGL